MTCAVYLTLGVGHPKPNLVKGRLHEDFLIEAVTAYRLQGSEPRRMHTDPTLHINPSQTEETLSSV